MTEHVR
jgi:hypothetical protein